MKQLDTKWKSKDYFSIYEFLKQNDYDYTINNFQRDFVRIDGLTKFGFLIYLISMDCSVKNILLLCDFLIYTDTLFYDVYSVVGFYLKYAILCYPSDRRLFEWIVSTFEGNPDSPFTQEELSLYKNKLST